jgi:hypothetical protein
MAASEDSTRATKAEMEKYQRDGFFVRESVLNESELAGICDGVEGIHRQIVEASTKPDADPARLVDCKRYQNLLGSSVQWEWREDAQDEIRTMEPYHHLDPVLDVLIDDIRLWGPSRAIVNSEQISLFSDKLNFKRPGGAPFPWHQDNPYWAFQCDHLDRLVSLAIVLDDSTIENGCLWLIPGSHKQGALQCFTDRGVVGRLYTDVDNLDLNEPEPIDVPAGSLVYFHGDIVHGSQVNRSDEERRLLLLTYQPEGLPRWQRKDIRPVAA